MPVFLPALALILYKNEKQLVEQAKNISEGDVSIANVKACK